MAFFISILRLWLIHLEYHSRFVAPSMFHQFVELAFSYLMVNAAAEIKPVQVLDTELFFVAVIVALGVRVLLLVELAVAASHDNARRWAARQLVVCGEIFCFWMLGYIFEMVENERARLRPGRSAGNLFAARRAAPTSPNRRGARG
eukprot:5903871-Prymnesium_polylepis.1